MARASRGIALFVLLAVLRPVAMSSQSAPARAPSPQSTAAPSSDWLTWGYDQERSAFNKGETTLSKDNVPGLSMLWSTKVPVVPKEIALSTLTSPLVVQGVGGKTLVFVVSMDDTVFAIDAETGKVVWQKAFPNMLKPPQAASWLCANSQNATPVIDKQKGIIYFNTSDGKLRGLSLTNGASRLTPTDFVTPFARNWSLNLIDDVIYSSTARGCGQAIANISAMDVSDPMHPHLSRLYTSGGRPAGAWGRGGVVKGPRGIITQTADGLYDPAVGSYGETVMALAPRELRIIDSFTPTNWAYLNSKDLDMGSANPVVFPFQGRTLVASISKEGVLYLLDANSLGGNNHTTPLYQSARLGNDEELLGGRGVWGALSTSEDQQGQRFLYVPMWGPASKTAPAFKYSYGDAGDGSIMAFQVTGDATRVSLTPLWISRNMHVPDPPVVANGVVYAIQTGENTAQNQPRAGGPGGARGGRGVGGAPGPGGAPGAPADPAARGAGRGRGAGAGQAAPPADGQGPEGGDQPAAGRGGGGGRGGRGPVDPVAAAAAAQAAAKFRATPVTNLVLYALDAQTGKELYSSEKIIPGWVHYSEPVVAAGKVFVVTWDARVYAFGLKK
ncbi:MAG TPA: PQQ-binding-like beta-propeller repeat protein [Vicinamibacterales bacterium]|jgi:outer membrane protein assembly factor BamB|nr:PQQ-binding-like beta-propeller repeat protein [Vicinamibacterales bacterium]